MRFPGFIFLILLALYIYAGWLAQWWTVMNTWTADSWAIFIGGVMLAWIGSNEFGGRRE